MKQILSSHPRCGWARLARPSLLAALTTALLAPCARAWEFNMPVPPDDTYKVVFQSNFAGTTLYGPYKDTGSSPQWWWDLTNTTGATWEEGYDWESIGTNWAGAPYKIRLQPNMSGAYDISTRINSQILFDGNARGNVLKLMNVSNDSDTSPYRDQIFIPLNNNPSSSSVVKKLFYQVRFRVNSVGGFLGDTNTNNAKAALTHHSPLWWDISELHNNRKYIAEPYDDHVPGYDLPDGVSVDKYRMSVMLKYNITSSNPFHNAGTNPSGFYFHVRVIDDGKWTGEIDSQGNPVYSSVEKWHVTCPMEQVATDNYNSGNTIWDNSSGNGGDANKFWDQWHVLSVQVEADSDRTTLAPYAGQYLGTVKVWIDNSMICDTTSGVIDSDPTDGPPSNLAVLGWPWVNVHPFKSYYQFVKATTTDPVGNPGNFYCDDLVIYRDDPGSFPAVPSMLTPVISGTTVTVKWKDKSDNEDHFEIERKTGLYGSYSTIATLGAGTAVNRTYPDSPGSGLYYYRVRATRNDGNNSAWSVEVPAQL